VSHPLDSFKSSGCVNVINMVSVEAESACVMFWTWLWAFEYYWNSTFSFSNDGDERGEGGNLMLWRKELAEARRQWLMALVRDAKDFQGPIAHVHFVSWSSILLDIQACVFASHIQLFCSLFISKRSGLQYNQSSSTPLSSKRKSRRNKSGTTFINQKLRVVILCCTIL
jgi:hypothetical protein